MSAGTVVTFYSYKGGVGRSFLLANAAAVLAAWGYKVLCIDWDLEAPGLHRFFEPFLDRPIEGGLVEMTTAYAEGSPVDWRDFRTPVTFHAPDADSSAAPATLDLIAAGRPDEGYISRLQRLSWDELFNEKKFGAWLEKTRSEWIDEYDFAFVDSRTGITDIGGICTVHLPDVLVLVFCANRQNLDGVIEVGRRAMLRRDDLPFDRSGLLVLPVPSRFERQEYELARHWESIFAEELADFYSPWLMKGLTPADVLPLTKIPYFTYWSFGEQLPVVREPRHTADTVSYFITSVAALLARQFDDTRAFVSDRDDYAATARRSGRRGSESEGRDVYLSYASADATMAERLAESLRGLGLTVGDRAGASGLKSSTDADHLAAELQSARHVVVIVGPALDEPQEASLSLALQRMVADVLADRQASSRVIFVHRGRSALSRLMTEFPRCPRIDAEGRSEDQLAEDVAAAAGHYDRTIERDEYYLSLGSRE